MKLILILFCLLWANVAFSQNSVPQKKEKTLLNSIGKDIFLY